MPPTSSEDPDARTAGFFDRDGRPITLGQWLAQPNLILRREELPGGDALVAEFHGMPFTCCDDPPQIFRICVHPRGTRAPADRDRSMRFAASEAEALEVFDEMLEEITGGAP